MSRFFIDIQMIKYFLEIINSRHIKLNSNLKYYESINLITKDNLNYFDCLQTFSFLKRNIHLNLYYYNQITQFLISCQNMLYLDINLDFD